MLKSTKTRTAIGSAFAAMLATAYPAAAVDSARLEESQSAFADAQAETNAAIASTVRRALEALRDEDAEGAYAAISPDAHRAFPTKEIYLAAMLERFTPLAYATWFELGELRQTSRGMAQLVRFADRRGKPFMSFFILQESETGWRIVDLIMVEMPASGA